MDLKMCQEVVKTSTKPYGVIDFYGPENVLGSHKHPEEVKNRKAILYLDRSQFYQHVQTQHE